MTQRVCTHTDLQGSSRILTPTRAATAIVNGMHEQLAGYISGPVNAEDLVVAPGGEWVLTSGMTGPTAPRAAVLGARRGRRL